MDVVLLGLTIYVHELMLIHPSLFSLPLYLLKEKHVHLNDLKLELQFKLKRYQLLTIRAQNYNYTHKLRFFMVSLSQATFYCTVCRKSK